MCIESDESAYNREMAKALKNASVRNAEKSSRDHRMFKRGKADRLMGVCCRSADGKYLDGWYSVPNNK